MSDNNSFDTSAILLDFVCNVLANLYTDEVCSTEYTDKVIQACESINEKLDKILKNQEKLNDRLDRIEKLSEVGEFEN